MTKEELKAIPAKLGMTTKEFAAALGGMSYKTVQSWFQGVRRPGKSATVLIEKLIEDHKKK